ncbi:hypothetical protein FB451DRAFT_1560510 [Mycena latifolia]|nr:hypothetical protein FB451DRAFT_1560510 [Mycena latifolia]
MRCAPAVGKLTGNAVVQLPTETLDAMLHGRGRALGVGRSFIEQLAETFFLRHAKLVLQKANTHASSHGTACILAQFGATFTGRPYHARCSVRPTHTSINIIAVKVTVLTQRAWRRTGSDATKISRTTAAAAVCISLTHLLVLAAANTTSWPYFLAERTDPKATCKLSADTHCASALQNQAVALCWFDNVAIFAQRRGRLADADDRRTWVRVAGGRFLPRGFDPVVVLVQPNAS